MNQVSISNLYKLFGLSLIIGLCACTKEDVNSMETIGGNTIRDTIEIESQLDYFTLMDNSNYNCFYKSCIRNDEVTEHYLVFGYELSFIENKISYVEELNILKWLSISGLENAEYLAQGVRLDENTQEVLSHYLVSINIADIETYSIGGRIIGENTKDGNFNASFQSIELSCNIFPESNALASVYSEGVLRCRNDSIISNKLCTAAFCIDDNPSTFPLPYGLIYGGGKMNVTDKELIVEETPELAIYVENPMSFPLFTELPGYYLELTQERLDIVQTQGPSYIRQNGTNINLTYNSFDGPRGATGFYQDSLNSSFGLSGNFTSTLFNCQ